jgi:hypothetical protein
MGRIPSIFHIYIRSRWSLMMLFGNALCDNLPYTLDVYLFILFLNKYQFVIRILKEGEKNMLRLSD